MNDSLRGVLIAITVIGLFITAILNFIILFPQEQGVVFTDEPSASDYLTISGIDMGTETSLTTLNNQSTTAYDNWDVTTGFMGTNQLKQGQGGVKTYSNNVFTNLKIIATQLFGANSPILYAIGVMALLTTGYLTYLFVKFVRTGT